MSTEHESPSPNQQLIKSRTFSYRDMLDAWVAGRKNLKEWGEGEGDKPDFASWIRSNFDNH